MTQITAFAARPAVRQLGGQIVARLALAVVLALAVLVLPVALETLFTLGPLAALGSAVGVVEGLVRDGLAAVTA